MADELGDVAGRPLLAIETATRVASVAVARGGEVVCERASSDDRQGVQSLLPLIDDALSGAGASLSEVGAFAVSIGPGAFTSLRIGLATVKGLAFDSGRPVAPVSSLAALAYGARHLEGPVIALLDARRGEAYAAGYSRADSGLADLLAEGVYDAPALDAALPRACTLVGEGAALFSDLLTAGALRLAADAPARPGAAAVAALGARSLARGEGVDPADLVPRYLRRPQAELELGRRSGGA